MGYRVVVAGATGNVGREILNILDERLFPIDDIVALASRRSLGTDCGFGTFAGFGNVDPDIAYLKLQSLVEGASKVK